MSDVPEILHPAIRQYRHNNSDGFVIACDLAETKAIIEVLQRERDDLRSGFAIHIGKTATLLAKHEELKRERDALLKVYNVANRMMADLGLCGEISYNTESPDITAMMDALHDVDGGAPRRARHE